ncbi:hypothetical protein MLGJGCBP_03069 [Rhodococcus sp. T7]|nr:hypothetical protein MLGJGCBP_03069 [Rhodococcus sp. T7]
MKRWLVGHLGRVFSVFPYIVIPLVSAGTPLLAIPAITARYGSDGWATMAIAQSIGSTAALIAELGWSVTGPQQVARAQATDRVALYRYALTTKLTVLASLCLPVILATFSICDSFKIGGVLVALGSASLALSPSWYFIGLGQPRVILIYESIPRVVLVGASALLIFRGESIAMFGLALAFSVAGTLVLVGTTTGLRWFVWRGNVDRLRRQRTVAIGRIIGGLYTSLPVALVGVINAGAVPEFSAADRLMRMVLNVLSGVPSRLQSWIGSADRSVRSARAKSSVRYNAVLGLAAGLVFAITAPSVASLLFSGAVHIDFLLSGLSGLLLFLICVSRGLGLGLVGAGRANSITVSVALCALLGVPAVLMLSMGVGARGAVLGEVIAEAFGIAIQLTILSRTWNVQESWRRHAEWAR